MRSWARWLFVRSSYWRGEHAVSEAVYSVSQSIGSLMISPPSKIGSNYNCHADWDTGDSKNDSCTCFWMLASASVKIYREFGVVINTKFVFCWTYLVRYAYVFWGDNFAPLITNYVIIYWFVHYSNRFRKEIIDGIPLAANAQHLLNVLE